jgi:hypothetical protein
VNNVTRAVLTLGAGLIGVGAAAAQAPERLRPAVLITEVPAAPFGGKSPLAAIERLLSFDANADRRLSRDELPERMQGLVARGDTNADAALDSDEIRALVTAAASERVRVAFRPQPSDGLPGVISDLKLPAAKHAQALAVVSALKLPRNVHAVSSDLDREMRALLDAEEYENFAAAAARLSRNPLVRIRTGSGIIGGVPLPSASGK